eukprot:scaffold71_cov247-Pinguiococcus_pyrenoidosus.AAC.11
MGTACCRDFPALRVISLRSVRYGAFDTGESAARFPGSGKTKRKSAGKSSRIDRARNLTAPQTIKRPQISCAEECATSHMSESGDPTVAHALIVASAV